MRYITPYSRLSWKTLEEWLCAADIISARRASFRKNQQREGHVSVLHVKLIYGCECRESLNRALNLLTGLGSDFMQPCRGQREKAPHTALIVAIKNRIAQINREEDLASMLDGHNSRNRI